MRVLGDRRVQKAVDDLLLLVTFP